MDIGLNADQLRALHDLADAGSIGSRSLESRPYGEAEMKALIARDLAYRTESRSPHGRMIIHYRITTQGRDLADRSRRPGDGS